MENIKLFLQAVIILFAAPILPGIINRVKAFFGGRQGRNIFQLYFDIYKLFNKGIVYSNTTTLIFRIAAPAMAALSCIAALIMPFGGQSGLLSFSGDFILIVYLLALSRFLLIISAMDTGSPFEGMGASREAQFAVFAEPVFFMSILTLSKITGESSVHGIFSKLSPVLWVENAPVLFLIVLSLFIVMLCETSRVPFDDPDTHLELTMIHEVMVLDNSGPDLGLIFYASAIKLWILGSFVSAIIMPRHSEIFWLDSLIYISGLAIVAISAGVVESVMARVRLLRVPQFLLAAFSVAIMAFVFQSLKG